MEDQEEEGDTSMVSCGGQLEVSRSNTSEPLTLFSSKTDAEAEAAAALREAIARRGTADGVMLNPLAGCANGSPVAGSEEGGSRVEFSRMMVRIPDP